MSRVHNFEKKLGRKAYIKNYVHVNWALPHILFEKVAKRRRINNKVT